MKHQPFSFYKRATQKIYKFSVHTLVAVVLILLIAISTLIISTISYTLSEQIIQRKSSLYCKDILKEISKNINIQLEEIDNITLYICCNETIQSQINKINLSEDEIFILNQEKTLKKELINLTVANDFLKEITIFTNSGYSIELYQPYLQLNLDTDLKELTTQSKGSLCWLILTEENDLKIYAGRTINSLTTQKPIGYFLVRFDEQLLTTTLSTKEYFNSGTLCIVDGSGRIISSNRTEQVGEIHPYFDLLTDKSVSKKLEDTQEWLHSCPIEASDWQLVSSIPNISYEREIISLRNCILIIAFFVLFSAIVIAIIVSKQLFRPLKELGITMENVGEGHFDVTKPDYCYRDIGDLYDYFIDMIHKIDDLIQTTSQQQLLLQKAELNSLRMQINPHFIYNTLESIKWMAYMDHNQEIVTMVKALGDFMRSNLSGPEFITLEAELQNINCYLLIQKLRYKDKLTCYIDIPTELYHAKIPKLIIQPLIENSIIHGLEQKIGKGYISVSAFRQKDVLIIDVTDNGTGFSKETLEHLDLNATVSTQSKSGGFGMRNVHQRIQMYYGKSYGLDIHSTFGIETRIRITLPYI